VAADELSDWAARIRALRGAAVETAKEAAPLIEAAVKATAAAGTTPSGQPWQPKKDGGPPLVHAADKVTAKATGATVLIELDVPEVFHQRSKGGRLPRREVIPSGGDGALPEPVAKACAAAAARVFARVKG
jgi:hypothetical protein